jgi:hypothetical protein
MPQDCGAGCGVDPEKRITKRKNARLQNRGFQVRVLAALSLCRTRKPA